jgi:uncharacterized membrane protein
MMTPTELDATLKYVTPAVQLGAVVLISRRISWRSHPALIAYLVSEVAVRLLLFVDYDLVLPFTLLRVVIRTAVVFEVLAFARFNINPEARARCVGLVLAFCALLAACSSELTPRQQTALFNQYYHLALCAALLAAVARRLAWPMLEAKRHRVYRYGIAAWLLVLAIASTFVKSGLAYRVFEYSRSTWAVANTAVYASLIIVVAVMAWFMVRALPKKQPAKVNKRARLDNVQQIRRIA